MEVLSLLKNILSERVGRVYDRMLENMGEIQEIRLRSDQPLIVRYEHCSCVSVCW